ncbi:MAG: hypothetical protein JWM88_1397 [Verrucomicrobia bacterium]|nr:hypothetical protein [Verrucomicrobiota bacterium]
MLPATARLPLMLRPPPPSIRLRPATLAALLGAVIFALRSATVFYAGSPVPFHDQWIAEATHLFVQDARHALTWHNFFIPNGDHLHVTTRLIAYGLYRLTGRWDVLAEMLVNNALVAAAFACVLEAVLRKFSGRAVAGAALVAAIWLGSPLFYGNTLWGFQSCIELLVLTAALQIVATCAMRGFDRDWWLAGVSAAIGILSFGSGWLASLVGVGICIGRFRAKLLSRAAFIAAIAVNLAVIAAGASLILRSPSLENSKPHVGNIAHTVLHGLSWPAMQPSWFALLLWLPAIAGAVALFQAGSRAGVVFLSLAVWTALQIGGIAFIRSDPVAAMAPRYYDIFAVGVLANAALAFSFAIVWTGCVGLKAWQFTRSHMVHDIPVMRSIAQGQIGVVTRYYSGEKKSALQGVSSPMLPYPDPGYLENLLADPTIEKALPRFLTAPSRVGASGDLLEYPWPETGLRRGAWMDLCMLLAGASAAAFLALAISTAGRIAPE